MWLKLWRRQVQWLFSAVAEPAEAKAENGG
jgi:hypothetical protein